ncbi:hypothetical protein FOZ61_010393 [Perkinsus olseni]|uniref:Uncharacterized protein n=1 Tax=Perkinsus olseni TaxID=32597 RepID=A0A7J6M353_PEROL|nr:hypothetical protein FOZ61_010393 [Perkinsus olseni]KAF4671492.1 hypothetical protein FOL46_000297 [Perkinsus olseni]
MPENIFLSPSLLANPQTFTWIKADIISERTKAIAKERAQSEAHFRQSGLDVSFGEALQLKLSSVQFSPELKTSRLSSLVGSAATVKADPSGQRYAVLGRHLLPGDVQVFWDAALCGPSHQRRSLAAVDVGFDDAGLRPGTLDRHLPGIRQSKSTSSLRRCARDVTHALDV